MRLFLSLLLVIALIGCTDTIGLRITEADGGQTFEVPLDASFEIWLPSNPSTGFGWSTEPYDGLDVTAPEYRQEGTGVGAGGTERFVVTARKRGRYFLVFEYLRPWEDVPPEQVFSVVIEVD